MVNYNHAKPIGSILKTVPYINETWKDTYILSLNCNLKYLTNKRTKNKFLFFISKDMSTATISAQELVCNEIFTCYIIYIEICFAPGVFSL